MEHAQNVQQQWPIVMYVVLERSVPHVQVLIIPMEVDVHYVLVKAVQHVMHQMVNVQHVQVDIICQEQHVQHVHQRWQIVQHVQPMEVNVQNVPQIIIWPQRQHVQHVQRYHNVQHVPKRVKPVPNVIQDIIQVE